MKLDLHLTQYTKIHLKQVRDLNSRLETVKLLEKDIGEKLLDVALSNEFSGHDTKSTGSKSKNQ